MKPVPCGPGRLFDLFGCRMPRLSRFASLLLDCLAGSFTDLLQTLSDLFPAFLDRLPRLNAHMLDSMADFLSTLPDSGNCRRHQHER